jgi:ABC-type multidrug transport system ATPase subunit
VEGTPLSLTKSYGDYLQVNLNLPPNRLDDATELLKDLSPSMTLKEGLGGTQKYELLGNETNVQAVLKTIIEHKDRLEIEDWGVQNASLEDVFVRMYGADADGEHEGSNESPLGALNDARAEQKRRQHTGELSCKEELSNFGRHSRVLLRKNIKIAARSRGATFGQVTASFFFMFFVWVVDQAVVAQRSSESRYQTVRTPDRDPIESIPLCEPIREGACYTFAYSPIGLPLVESVVASIRSNNDPVIAPDGIIGFASGVEADAYALAHPETISGAVHFFVEGSSKVNFELQFNSSVVFSRGKFDNPERKYAVPLQHAVERALIRYHLDDPALPIDVAVREFAHPAFRGGSIVGRVGAPFFFAGAMFSFVITIGAVVSERETKLRQAMEGMGLQRAGFWFTWLLFELCMVTLSSLCMIFFGVVLQFDLFLKNAFLLSFLLIFLFQLSMLGLAFLLSTMTNKSASATTIGFMVFLFGFVVQLVVGFGFPFTEEYNSGWQTVFALFPPSLLAKGLGDLGKYTAREESVGLDWAERHSYCEDEELCTMSLAEIYEWFVFTFFLYLTLALYFDRVMPDDGVTLPPWFCLSPGYWCKSKSIQEDRTAEDFGEPDDDDVAAESGRIKARVGSAMNPEAAVEIRGLTKKFGSCYSRKKPFHAVKGPWYEIRKNELFCLLGPNGAGKTTTINMLVGNLPPTSGEALQLGESIRSPAGMDLIRRRIGVCPQFDVQWGQLTAYEHLHLFGTLKGLAGDSVALHAEIIQRLLQVGLVKKEPWLVGVHNGAPQIKVGTGTRVATFSGGEKRRLSVAMALMGEPDLLYLDEPTTGMDPISRREVWNLIHACKDPVAHPGRAIVLTTHSMEEAEILSDRVAIMARGSMRCIGSSLRLKQKFGASFAVAIGVKSHQTGADVAAAFGSIGVDPDKASGRTDASNGRTRTPPETPGEVDPPNVVNVASVNVAESISADAKLQVLRFTVPRGKETELVALMEKVCRNCA